MKTWLAILAIILFLAPSIASSRGIELRKETDKYAVEVTINRNPPVLGDNHIEIEIKDGGGKSVTEAKVLVNYYMPPMPRMAPMNYVTSTKLRGEKYKATMNFIMTGPWIIAIKITLAGRTSTAKFNVDAQ
jgi:hypothetical protein